MIYFQECVHITPHTSIKNRQTMGWKRQRSYQTWNLFIYTIILFTISLNCTLNIVKTSWRYGCAIFAIVINCMFFCSVVSLLFQFMIGSCRCVDGLWFLMSFVKRFSTVNVHMLYRWFDIRRFFWSSINCVIMTDKPGILTSGVPVDIWSFVGNQKTRNTINKFDVIVIFLMG